MKIVQKRYVVFSMRKHFKELKCLLLLYGAKCICLWCYIQIDDINLFNIFNPFSTKVPFLYPLQISENRRFSAIFRGYRSGTLVENGLRITCNDKNTRFLTTEIWQVRKSW